MNTMTRGIREAGLVRYVVRAPSVVIMLFWLSLQCPGVHAGQPTPAYGADNGDLLPKSSAAKTPAGVPERLAAGTPQDLIVLFDDSAVEREIGSIRQKRGLIHDDEAVLESRVKHYRDLKERALKDIPSAELETRREYRHLPMAFLRVRSINALRKLLERPDVLAVYENGRLYHQLTQSLPLIGQSQSSSIGYKGSGTSVAVLDTGVNHTLSAFGSCTAPGTPAGCRVSASVDIAPDDGALDDHGHGTNVAGIIAGTASEARIVSVDVFSSDGTASFDQVIDGIEWAITNKTTYNIVAINMSLGDGNRYTSACSAYPNNIFVTPVNNARAAGIISVAASGNDAYTTGISMPACTPGIVSVGAVYDANVGSRSWSACTDASTAADKVTCFSNSASFMTMLAPGALITSAGTTMAGTSQAAPHAAGAVAVLRAAFSGETLDQTVARLTGNGVSVTDPRNGIVKPRLNLLAAIGAPGNDNFAAAPLLAGDGGTVTGFTYNASKETGEPNHAANSGGASIWWKWIPSFSGKVAMDTHGSGFNTLLAVYVGTQVGNLSQAAANDDDGTGGGVSGLTFTATAGAEYRIAVDGSGGASGKTLLNWNLTPQADLSLSVSDSPDPVSAGGTLTYTLAATNLGPSNASGVIVTDTLPANADFVSASSGCSCSGNTVTCDHGDLPAGEVFSSTIIVRPHTAGQLDNNASVAWTGVDPVSANNSASADTVVTEQDPVAVPALQGWGFALAVAFLALGIPRRNKPSR